MAATGFQVTGFLEINSPRIRGRDDEVVVAQVIGGRPLVIPLVDRREGTVDEADQLLPLEAAGNAGGVEHPPPVSAHIAEAHVADQAVDVAGQLGVGMLVAVLGVAGEPPRRRPGATGRTAVVASHPQDAGHAAHRSASPGPPMRSCAPPTASGSTSAASEGPPGRKRSSSLITCSSAAKLRRRSSSSLP